MKEHSSLLIPVLMAVGLTMNTGALNAQTSCDDLEITVDHGCLGEGNGWASLSAISGATFPAEILWSNGATVQFVTGLENGEHWVMLTDSEGCWVKEYFTIACGSSDCGIDLTVQWGCFDEDTGWASLDMISGATNPTTILWSTGETSLFVTGLENGDHWVMVTDAAGCWTKEYFTVDCIKECEIVYDLDYGCEGEYGWASVGNIQADHPTWVIWSTGATTNSISGLISGDYWVTVFDEFECEVKEYFTIDCGPEPEECQLRTQTMGGWGAPPNGNNPGVYLHANFAAAFPNGLTIGCDNTLSLTSAQAVTNFLPSGGQPGMLPAGSMTDPTSYGNVFAGQLVALTISVGLDWNDPDFGTGGNLADAVINTGMFQGWTVQQLLDEANSLIGGCGSNYSASQLSDALAMVNENFVDGDTDEGNLDCPPTIGLRSLIATEGTQLNLHTFPNPAKNMLQLEMQADQDGVIDLVVMDALGRTMFTHNNEQLNAGEPRLITLDVDQLGNGTYFIGVMRNGVLIQTERVLIAR